MSQTYQEALKEFEAGQRKFGVQGQVAKLRSEQADWLRVTRNGCEVDTDCLKKDVHTRRIEAVRPKGD